MTLTRCLPRFLARLLDSTPPCLLFRCSILNRTMSTKSSTKWSSTVIKSTSHDDDQRTYEDAIDALNSLQTNVSAFAVAASRVHRDDNTTKIETEKYLMRTGISLEQLDSLSVIHVAGTKGKGSTCAMTESILRSCGLRTGFYSSPHLVQATERFRLDGIPISKLKFNRYFWPIYDKLIAGKQSDADMPAYFKFLTVMAFHVFIGESVDVAILEVGIGGEHDCTNIVRNTKTAGITALGLDHTMLLGDTLPEIAWQKTGIIKTGCNLFTAAQPPDCIDTIQKRCEEKEVNLNWVPDLSAYTWHSRAPSNLQISHTLNGSLAIQLAYDWMKSNPLRVKNQGITTVLQNSNGMCLEIFDEVKDGLEQFQWPGRFHEYKLGSNRVFIDGSHTLESLQICIGWFKQQTSSNHRRNVLIFNVTGDRNADQMLRMLHSAVNFQLAAFTPNVAQRTSKTNSKLDAQTKNCNHWQDLDRTVSNTNSNELCGSKVFASVEEVFLYLESERNINHEKRTGFNVLVTGSLYLVGATVELLDLPK